MSVEIKNNLLIVDWKGSKITHKQRVEELASLCEITPKLEFMLKKSTVNKVAEAVRTKFETSLTDVMAVAICMESKDNIAPYISRNVDYDSYTHWIRVCYRREIDKHVRKYGGF